MDRNFSHSTWVDSLLLEHKAGKSCEYCMAHTMSCSLSLSSSPHTHTNTIVRKTTTKSSHSQQSSNCLYGPIQLWLIDFPLVCITHLPRKWCVGIWWCVHTAHGQMQCSTAMSQFNEWPRSTHFGSLNQEFTLTRDLLVWNSILVMRFCTLNRDFTLNRDSLNRDFTAQSNPITN